MMIIDLVASYHYNQYLARVIVFLLTVFQDAFREKYGEFFPQCFDNSLFCNTGSDLFKTFIAFSNNSNSSLPILNNVSD